MYELLFIFITKLEFLVLTHNNYIERYTNPNTFTEAKFS